MKQEVEEQDKNFFAKEVARKVTGSYKQNAVIMCLGNMGTGKSWTMIELARQISFYIAKKLGGKPEDYFNMDHVGIMVMDEISKIYEHMDTHSHMVYIIDDAGATFNSRRFSSDNNIAQNDRIQTMRPHSNVVIFTTPQKSLMDKVVRNLSGYMIFMKDPMFQIGMTTCDIRKIEVDLAGDKERVFRKYLQNHRGDKYKLHIFQSPPKEWTDEYDVRRAAAEKKLAEKSRETIAKANELKQPKEKKTDFYKQHVEKYEAMKNNWIRGKMEWESGIHGTMSFPKFCQERGLPEKEPKLRQYCIENELPYQQVLKAKAE